MFMEFAECPLQWTRVHVLDGKEHTLLLGRQFLRHFGRVIFEWEDGTITLGNARAEIQDSSRWGLNFKGTVSEDS